MALNTATDSLETNTPKTGGGFTLGQSASDLVGIHGATPIAQASCPLLLGTLTGSADGTIADVAAIDLDTSDTYSDDDVNTAVNAAITSTNLQLKELHVKLNAVIQLLINKGIAGA